MKIERGLIRGNVIRSIAVASVGFIGALTFSGCTGERPTLGDRPVPKYQDDLCTGDEDFTIPEREGPDLGSYSRDVAPAYNERYSRYEQIEEEFRASNSTEDSLAIANDALRPFKVTVDLAGITPVELKDVTYDQSKITPDLVRISARNMIRDTLNVPDPIMEHLTEDGLDVHFVHSLAVDKQPTAATLYDGNDGRKKLLLGVDADIDTGDTYQWAIVSMMVEKGCTVIDPSYVRFNPKKFNYEDPATLPKEWQQFFLSPESATSAKHDVYAMYNSIFFGDSWGLLSDCNPAGGENPSYDDWRTKENPVCGKWRLLIRRLALIDKSSAEELATT